MGFLERDRSIGRVQTLLERVGRMLAYLGASLILIGAVLVGFDVVARKAFKVSIMGADELTAYGLAVAFTWGCAHTLFQKGHIRVDSLYIYLPLRVRGVLDSLALLALAGVVGLLTYRGGAALHETISINARSSTPLGTPLWIPQSLWLIGLVFFLLCVLSLLARVLHALAGRDFHRISEIAGAASLHDGALDRQSGTADHGFGDRPSDDGVSK